jgi:5-amino-6-(5-phosphoribosylamino)uracil reductase
VLLSAAVSLDGALDDRSPRRLILSGPEDLDAVDELRAGCDAILVGAGTVRTDDPRLLVRSERRRTDRVSRGLPPSPVRVVLTRSGELDPDAAVFADGPAPLLLGGDLPDVLAELADRGVRRLLVEGGAGVLTALLSTGLADELRLAVAPVFVGDPAAPRLLGPPVPADAVGDSGPGAAAGAADPLAAPGAFGGGRRRLLGVRAVGDTAVLRYAL